MAELLVELLTEDIPARMQVRAADDFKKLVEDRLKKAGLEYSEITAHSTPRRLVLVVDGLPVQQPDTKEERKGPKVGAPEKACEGFLRSAGLESLDQCEQRDTPKGAVWFAVKEIKGRATADILSEILPEAMTALPWPKSMRWSNTPFRWVRPLRNILAVFGGETLAFGFDLQSGKAAESLEAAQVEGQASAAEKAPKQLKASNITFGHRFMAPDQIAVTDFADYKAQLLNAKVMLDRADRRTLIETQAKALAEKEGIVLWDDKGLLEEVTGLVEWPVVLIGSIDDEFMSVPKEVLTTSMKEHQKYFATRKTDGELAPRFIVVANIEATDGGAKIVAGNERVLRARLADAKFFWDNDRKISLEDRLPQLEKITFHAKLGTLSQRVERMEALAGLLADKVGADKAQASRAAKLAKADLVSEMVFEFTDLQGLMGSYYAQQQNEAAEISEAVRDHYAPQGPSDSCPSAPVSVAVALAEKLDTLAGFFAIEEKPTGSKDPYALRRAALGIIRLIVENKQRLSLTETLTAAVKLYADQQPEMKIDVEAVVADLMSFFSDRLKVVLKDKGVRHDLIDAVYSLGNEDDFVRLLARVDALAGFLGTEDGGNLLAAYRRAANIVRIESKKDGAAVEGSASADLFDQAEEKSLFDALGTVAGEAQIQIEQEQFETAMGALAGLRQPVDAFFDKVTVNAEDANLRTNRLKLLSSIQDTLHGVADFSRIEG